MRITRKHKQPQAKRFPASVWVIATTLLVFIISQLIAALVVEAVYVLTHRGADAVDALNGSAPSQFFYVLIAEVLAVALVWLAIRGRGLGLSAIGMGRAPKWRDLKNGLLGFAAFYVILIAITLIVAAIIPSLNANQKQDLGFNKPTTSLDETLTFAGLVILPPIAEEVLVRGYLYSGLRSRWKFAPALIVTSLIFGLAHLQIGDGAPLLWAAALDTFVLSVVLVYIREKTGVLYAGMLIHMLNNLIAYGVHFK